MCGITSYTAIAANFAEALQDPGVRGILFDVDSPGGETVGCFELCDQIYSSRGQKPIYAVANDLAASAAYAIASAADRVFVTRMGAVGSVGVFACHVDQSRADAKAGFNYEFVYAGARKIVEHEAGQFEQWLRTQGVVPTIRALRDHFAHVADAEVGKALDQLAKKDLTREQQRELLQRTVQLVVNKLLHAPTAALRGAGADEATVRAALVCELFGLDPSEEPEPVADTPATEQAAERKAQA